ncbi:hypothetical protein T484DRAFT_1895315 [Baffinella frigidus]|nr:hypothetical protein T484DRAFT_1895315 [Cryptophyta sp. CCMP2293]
MRDDMMRGEERGGEADRLRDSRSGLGEWVWEPVARAGEAAETRRLQALEPTAPGERERGAERGGQRGETIPDADQSRSETGASPRAEETHRQEPGAPGKGGAPPSGSGSGRGGYNNNDDDGYGAGPVDGSRGGTAGAAGGGRMRLATCGGARVLTALPSALNAPSTAKSRRRRPWRGTRRGWGWMPLG